MDHGTAALERWRTGADVDLLAPFASPSDVLGDGRVLVLLARDEDALGFAAATGAELILRTTPRAHRNRSLTSGPPVASPVLATSVDALRSPIVHREIAGELASAPWCLWWPESIEPGQPGHGGRGAWLATLREGFSGPLLRRWSDRSLAPAGVVSLPGVPGALRWGAAADGVLTGRAVARGPVPDAWIRAAGRAGQARRSHELAEPFPRAWRQAEDALRDEDAGIDLLPQAGPGLPRGRTATVAVAGLWALAVPDGAAIGWAGAATAGPGATPSSEEGSGWCAWAASGGGEAALEAGQAAGLLAGLRASWFEVLVADHHRFRPPFVDREPEYADFHRAYTEGMKVWGLAERAALVLSDRGPRDLVALGRALDRSPAWLADVLLALADDGLVAASLRPRPGGADWQSDGPRPDGLPPVPAADPRVQAVFEAPGCRAQALAAALGVDDPGACGRCDRCEPGDGWERSLHAEPVRPSGPIAHAPSSASALDLGSLFKGLGESAAPAPAADTKAPASPALRSVPALASDASDADIAAALEAGASAADLWVAAAYQHRGPIAGRPLPDDARAALLDVLLDRAVDGATVSWGDGGRLHLHLRAGPGRGSHQFRPREDGEALLARLAPHDVDGGPLRALLVVHERRRAREAWRRAVGAALADWQAERPGLPGPELLEGLDAPPPTAEELGDWLAGDDDASAVARSLGQPADLARIALDRLGGTGVDLSPAIRLALRALAEAGPTLSPWAAQRWLASGEPLPASLLGAVRGGTARSWGGLLEAAPAADRPSVLRAAVAAGTLPPAARAEALALDPAPSWRASVLCAAPSEGDVWPIADEELSVQEALVQALGSREDPTAAALAEQGRTFLERVAADRRTRAAILEGAAAGRVAAAFTALAERDAPAGRHFAPSPAEEAAFARLRSQAAEEQRAYTPALARALAAGPLAAGPLGTAGVTALRDAARSGWGGALVALLGAQARRHPDDPARRAWLGRALLAAGRWSEAHDAFVEADRLLGGEPGLDLRWEGLCAVLAAAPDRAMDWLEGLVLRGPAQEVARRIALLAWGPALPPAVRTSLVGRLKAEGDSAWAGALRSLEQTRR